MGEILGEWSVHGAVGVEVVSEDEPRPGCGRSLDDRFHQRRVELRPLRIRWVGTVVDDGRSIARALDLGDLHDVRGDDLHVIRQVGPTASAHGSNPFPSPCQVPGHGEPQRTRPEDDVEAPRSVHGHIIFPSTGSLGSDRRGALQRTLSSRAPRHVDRRATRAQKPQRWISNGDRMEHGALAELHNRLLTFAVRKPLYDPRGPLCQRPSTVPPGRGTSRPMVLAHGGEVAASRPLASSDASVAATAPTRLGSKLRPGSRGASTG